MRYWLGGSLPAYRSWVFHDLTDSGWWLRALARVAFQLSPFVVLCLFVPGITWEDKGFLVALLVLSCLLTIGIAVEQVRDRRLRQHGFEVKRDDPPRGTYG